jgi:hypothetical protein
LGGSNNSIDTSQLVHLSLCPLRIVKGNSHVGHYSAKTDFLPTFGEKWASFSAKTEFFIYFWREMGIIFGQN